MKVVIDTNILVSGLIKPTGIAGRVLHRLRMEQFSLVYSDSTLAELARVLSRPQIQNKYNITNNDVRTVLQLIILRGEEVAPTERINVCRDVRDNIFLEVAIAGQVDALVSGDADLLVLHPFRKIPILTLKQFLTQLDT